MNNKLLILWLCLTIVIGACKKEQNNASGLDDGKSTVIRDLAGDTEAAVGAPIPGKEQRPFYTFLYRFSDQKQTWIRNAADSLRWLKSSEWDIAFTGPYNSEIYVNNGSVAGSPGYGGLAATKVVMLEKPYAEVAEAPAGATFSASPLSKIAQLTGSQSAGWFTYNNTSHIMQAAKGRTYVFRLTDGKFVKLEMLSAYLGNPPAVTDLYWPAPYFTFRYFLQRDGSGNLNTK